MVLNATSKLSLLIPKSPLFRRWLCVRSKLRQGNPSNLARRSIALPTRASRVRSNILPNAIEGARTRVGGPPLLRPEPRRREGPDRPGRPDPPERRDRTHPADGARTPSSIDSYVIRDVETRRLPLHLRYAEPGVANRLPHDRAPG